MTKTYVFDHYSPVSSPGEPPCRGRGGRGEAERRAGRWTPPRSGGPTARRTNGSSPDPAPSAAHRCQHFQIERDEIKAREQLRRVFLQPLLAKLLPEWKVKAAVAVPAAVRITLALAGPARPAVRAEAAALLHQRGRGLPHPGPVQQGHLLPHILPW